MENQCGTIAENHLMVGAHDEQGCILPIGHAGPHEFVSEDGTHWQWETDMECGCEHCKRCDGDYCISYWQVVPDANAEGESQKRTLRSVPSTVLAEAKTLFSNGYHGLQKDVAEKLSWPVSRVASIARGVVLTGAKRYGPPGQQVQAVVAVARTLVENKRRF